MRRQLRLARTVTFASLRRVIIVAITLTSLASMIGFSGLGKEHIPAARASGCGWVRITTDTSNTAGASLADGWPWGVQFSDAIMLVTPVLEPNYVFNDHPIAVWWSGSTWYIFNADLAAMPLGASFNYLYYPGPIYTDDADVYLHTATVANITTNATFLDDSEANDNPRAVIFATQVWVPNGRGSADLDPHPIGVEYIDNRWAIFNEDGAPMPVGASFNVFIGPVPAAGAVQTATAGNTAIYGTLRISPTPPANDLFLVTPNFNPPGQTGVLFNHNLAVFVRIRQKLTPWPSITTQDRTWIQVGASFNVYPHPPCY